MSLSLPADLTKDGQTRTASTPAEYYNLVWAGFSEKQAEEGLSPQQKAARTRAANAAKSDADTSQEGTTEPSGDANQS